MSGSRRKLPVLVPSCFLGRSFRCLAAALCFGLLCGSVLARDEAGLKSYESWVAACSKLPPNRSLHGRLPRADLLPLRRFQEFDLLLSALLEQFTTNALSQSSNWVGNFPGPSGFFNITNAYFLPGAGKSIPFQPFAQKANVAPESRVFFHADFHGDVRSLLADLAWLNGQGYLRGFSVARPDFYMTFLGDYTDRGSYGIEVLYTLFRLKLENPEHVFLVRGNHEEVSLQSRYGFLEEGRAKYGADFNAQKILRVYDFLPVVLYLGSGENYIQCNHGGMEPGFAADALLAASGSARFQVIGILNQLQFFDRHPAWLRKDDSSRELAHRALRNFQPQDPISPATLGFMWNDFSLLASEPQFGVDPGRAFVYGQEATRYLLEQAGAASNKLHAVFRGHQQSPVLNPMMRRLVASRGVFRHWQSSDSAALLNRPVDELAAKLETSEERRLPHGSVWTFNVSPDSIYGEGCQYAFDAFGLLKLAPSFEEWRLQVVNVPVK